MTITLTFSSMDEMLDFCRGVAAKSRSKPKAESDKSKPRMYRKTGLVPQKSPGESLKHWRKVNTLTQGDAGQLFGYTCHDINGALACAAISHIERGKCKPSVRVRQVIENFTGIPADSWTKEA